jgi:hypothetical protein
MYVSIFENVDVVSKAPAKAHIDKVLERIKTGEKGIKDNILKIRSVPQKDRRALKKNLMSVVFSGYLGNPMQKTSRSTGTTYNSYRDDASLSEHSGFCVIDIDHISSKNEVEYWKDTFAGIKHVYSVFISPSGDGLKVIYKIPADIKMHRGHYMAILQDIGEMTNLEVDTTSQNESRLCFISYDPDIYINKDAVEFSDFIDLSEEVNEVADAIVPQGDGKTDFKKLAIAAEMIDKAQDGHKHTTLIKASYLMGGYIASGMVREDDARKMLQERISGKNLQNKKLAFNTIEDGLCKGRTKPIYEIEQIETEFQTEITRDKYKDAKRVFSFLVDSKDIDRKMMDYIQYGERLFEGTGLKKMDEHYRFKENNFEVVLGHDNVGKSTVIWWLAAVSCALLDWKWIIYSSENDSHKVKKKMLDFILGKQSKHASAAAIEKAKKLVDTHFYFIRNDNVVSVFELLEYGQVLCEKDENIKGFMIDPYNSLSLDYKHPKGTGLSSYEYHMRAIGEIRVFSQKFCSVYVNAHSVTGSRRGISVDEDGNIKRPQKSDIDLGAVWANRCDNFYVIHRKVKDEDEWMWTEFHVDKIKDVESGGSVTRGEPVRIKLMHYAAFEDESGKDPLTMWREKFFMRGEQKSLPLGNPADVF